MKKKLLGLAALVLCLYGAVHFAYGWLQGRVNAVLGPGAVPTAQNWTAEAEAPADGLLTHDAAIQRVVERNIFGAALDGAPEAAGRDFRLDDLADESGAVALLGTVTGDDQTARAIIRIGTGKERLYRKGERVRGAEITRIERGRVELAAAGGPEVLLIRARENRTPPRSVETLDAPGALTAPEEAEESVNETQGQQMQMSPQEALSRLREVQGGRVVPQSLPGRRVNTGASAPKAPAATGGPQVRTGAEALRPMENSGAE